MIRMASVILVAVSLKGLLLAETLESRELDELERYLGSLRAGQPGSAAEVERFADGSYAGLRMVIEGYTALEAPIESHTHRAFQTLLERMSRSAYAPWPMVTLYSPEFADFLTRPVGENPLGERLFQVLIESGLSRSGGDLAVRLTPEASLQYLADGHEAFRSSLLEAWNRRLARGNERRPIASQQELVAKIAAAISFDRPAAEVAAHLQFTASWPVLHEQYQAALGRCLASDRDAVVLAGLRVQRHHPALLAGNTAIIDRFRDHPEVVEAVLRGYAFDLEQDHSAVLRGIWGKLRPEEAKARYACLFSMGNHPQGNAEIALSAVRQRAFAFIDVAMPVLAAGDPEIARAAVAHVLRQSERGHEEALRLARELRLEGFEDDAVRIASDGERDQILRQTAMQYLELADGATRRRLLPLLAHSGLDLRLAAIGMFARRDGLTAEDMSEIGPALIQVAQNDPSMGHRQEAIFALGQWKVTLAEPFFRQVLQRNPPVPAVSGHDNDARYWQYRLRLVALLGLARLGRGEARQELIDLHEQGGPTERMDALLAFLELGEVPELALDDLASTEPKLVATAARLIRTHGDEPARSRLHRFIAGAPLWREFADSGLDDHNILEWAGAVEE